MSDALVLGGGGVGGIAWITGVLAGLADAGQDVTGADLLLGTSAGSTVSAQLGSGLALAELYARQVDPALQSAEIMAVIDLDGFAAEIGAAASATASVPELRRAVGRAALAAPTVAEPRRRAVIESRLPSHGWPERALRIVAVDAESGEPRVFDKGSGVPLVDAVAASCAVPGVWPPVGIGGRRYVDGGVRSMANLDLVDAPDRVVVIVPMGLTEPFPSEQPVERSVRELRARGTEVVVVAPDEAARAAIGDNPLDPGTRVPAAEAGRTQGRALRLPWHLG
ncbi:patatin-like phospholipase family protein [Streptomyces cellostaticus]|uniref:patatin-like phospholipase family protein n=1 Tax=Streptomyces TaxID=1883 RepID=UPI0020276809|nr:patatin-like phospholipase family protein [Streptomyces cellostaticus]